MDGGLINQVYSELIDVRAKLISRYPFYGRLLMRLQIGFAECQTACTDAKRIIFDPDFVRRLTEDQLVFLFLHELLHCVLHHCTRGRGLLQDLYNIACDIVVNSFILESMGSAGFEIDGNEVIHLAPDGTEGREHTAEKVYEMLLCAPEKEIERMYGGSGMDRHILWDKVVAGITDDEWNEYIKEAAWLGGSEIGVPLSIKRYLYEVTRTPKTNWRQLLQDFIRHDRSDYSYSVPDRRYQGDIIMPSFLENVYGYSADKLWFVVDTSGSISDEVLSSAFNEIKGAVDQMDSLSGELSFFDTDVSEPVPFESAEDLAGITTMGGGGTSFRSIFRFMKAHYGDQLPKAAIILTDGEAVFPDEEDACGVPVMWIMLDSGVEAPWGECIHIES